MSKPLFTKAQAKRVRNAILAYVGWQMAGGHKELRLTWARVIRDEQQVFAECNIDVSDILRELDGMYHHDAGSA
ncbi:hypothetical protein [Rhizobium phage RHph_X3_2]|nr:hypothetical protein [Rhizobium phage RHph_X3_2]